jgi:hypothetical protein
MTSDKPLIHPPEDSIAVAPASEDRLLAATNEDRFDPTEESTGDGGLLLNPVGSRIDEVELRDLIERAFGASPEVKDPVVE